MLPVSYVYLHKPLWLKPFIKKELMDPTVDQLTDWSQSITGNRQTHLKHLQQRLPTPFNTSAMTQSLPTSPYVPQVSVTQPVLEEQRLSLTSWSESPGKTINPQGTQAPILFKDSLPKPGLQEIVGILIPDFKRSFSFLTCAMLYLNQRSCST